MELTVKPKWVGGGVLAVEPGRCRVLMAVRTSKATGSGSCSTYLRSKTCACRSMHPRARCCNSKRPSYHRTQPTLLSASTLRPRPVRALPPCPAPPRGMLFSDLHDMAWLRGQYRDIMDSCWEAATAEYRPRGSGGKEGSSSSGGGGGGRRFKVGCRMHGQEGAGGQRVGRFACVMCRRGHLAW